PPLGRGAAPVRNGAAPRRGGRGRGRRARGAAAARRGARRDRRGGRLRGRLRVRAPARARTARGVPDRPPRGGRSARGHRRLGDLPAARGARASPERPRRRVVKVLVTGAHGKVGRALTRRRALAGHGVRATDLTRPAWDRLDPGEPEDYLDEDGRLRGGLSAPG